jgi:hypothetical protein
MKDFIKFVTNEGVLALTVSIVVALLVTVALGA